MPCRAVYYALDAEQVQTLKTLPEGRRIEYVDQSFEVDFQSPNPSRSQPVDKTWDAMHRSLTDGRLKQNNGTYPLNHVVLGGEVLHDKDDYTLSLKSPDQVRDIALALAELTKGEFQSRYNRIRPRDYGMPLCEEDCEATWAYLEDLTQFYRRAASAGFSVLFTVDH